MSYDDNYTVENESAISGTADTSVENAEKEVKKVSVLYKILGIVFAALLIALEVYGVILFFAGGISYDEYSLSIPGFIKSIKDFKDYIEVASNSSTMMVNIIMRYICVWIGCVTCVVFAVISLIKLIKLIIAFVKYLKTLGAADSENDGYKAFEVSANNALKVTGFAFVIFIMLGVSITKAALALIILCGIVYFSINIWGTLFINGRFEFNGKETILSLAEKSLCVLLAVAFILVINSESNSMFSMMNQLGKIVLNENKLEGKLQTATVLRKIVLPMFGMIINCFLGAFIMSMFMRKGYLTSKSAYTKDGQKLTKGTCRVAFIVVVVFVIIAYVIDCAARGMVVEYEVKDYFDLFTDYISLVLAMICGIILNPLYNINQEYYIEYDESNL